MKIHLPSRLRKALLACLAALAIPATLPGTLGTASGVAAVWLVSSQSAQADEDYRPAPDRNEDGRPDYDWQRVDVQDGDVLRFRQGDIDKKEGLYKTNSGTLTVTESLEAAGLDLEAGVLHIDSGATLTVGDLFNSSSTITGGGTLAFRAALSNHEASTGPLLVENLVFLGGKNRTYVTLSGEVRSSKIEVRQKGDTLIVEHFTNTESLTKEGDGDLRVRIADDASLPGMKLTLNGTGTLQIEGDNVSLSFSNLTWSEGSSQLTLSGSIGNEITGDVVLDGGRNLYMGHDAHISNLTVGENGHIRWLDTLTVSTLRVDTAGRDLLLEEGTTLSLFGVDETSFVGDIVPRVKGTHGGNLNVTGFYTLSGEVDVAGTTVGLGRLTLDGADKNKHLGVLHVGRGAELVVQGAVTAGFGGYTSNGTVTVKGELILENSALGSFEGTLSVGKLTYDGLYENYGETATLGGQVNVSSSVIEVTHEDDNLTVTNYATVDVTSGEGQTETVNGSLIKQGKGTLTLENGSFTWTGQEGSRLELQAGTLVLKGLHAELTLGDGNVWDAGTTLRIEGESYGVDKATSTLHGDVQLDRGRELSMGTNAVIEGDVKMSGGLLRWDDNLTVGSLHGDTAIDGLTSGRVLILGEGESDFAGNLTAGFDILASATGGTLEVAGGSHTFSGMVGTEHTAFGVTLKSGKLTFASSGSIANLKDLTFRGNAELEVNRTVNAERLLGGTGKVSGTGTLDLSSVKGSNYTGSVSIGSLILERGYSTLGDSMADNQVEVKNNLVLGTGTEAAQLRVKGGLKGGHAGGLTLGGTLTLTLSSTVKGMDKPYVRTDRVVLPDGKLKLVLHDGGNHLPLLSEVVGKTGNYYLLTGLPEGTTMDKFDITDFQHDMDVFASTLNAAAFLQYGADHDFKLELVVRGDSLVLAFSQNDPNRWVWKARKADGSTETHTWSDGSQDGWGRHNTGAKPAKQDVWFEGSERRDDVQVSGTVTPNSVHVTDGEYHFASAGKIQLPELPKTGDDGTTGHFVVEGGIVDMQVETNIPVLDLQGGRFIIDHTKAIQSDTKVNLHSGAVLAFGETGTGEVVAVSGVNGKTLAENTTLFSGTLNIQVGKTYDEFVKDVGLPAEGYTVPEGEQTIGGTFGGRGSADNYLNVVEEAMHGAGVHKTGRLGLVLEWNDSWVDHTFTGGVTVEEGSLTLKVHGQEGEDVVLAGDVTVHKGSTLKLQGDVGETVVVGTSLQAAEMVEKAAELLTNPRDRVARVVLGSSGDGAIYEVSGANKITGPEGEVWSFDGTIELAGNSTSDVAVFTDEAATGGSKTTLELNGRALTFVDMDPWRPDNRSFVTAGTINVVGGINMVGGYGITEYESDPNVHITLSGGKITGNGTLANAEMDFHHVIDEDISGFTGAIVAGYVQEGHQMTKPETEGEINPDWAELSPSRSTWELRLHEGVTELGNTLAGTGIIKVVAQGPLSLTGVVGDDEKLGNSVSLENGGKDAITLTGKNVTTGRLLSSGGGGFILDGTGATWVGSELGDGVTFTLVEGALKHPNAAADPEKAELGGITKKGKGARLVVDALGTVDVNGTAAELLDSVKVTAKTVLGVTETGEEVARYGKLEGLVGHVGEDGTKKVFDTSKTGVTLVFDEHCFDNADAAMLSFKEDDGTLKATQDEQGQGKGLVLDFTTEGLVELLRKHSVDKDKDQFGHGNVTDLYIVKNGTLDLSDILGKDGGYGNALRLLTEEGTYGDLLVDLGLTLDADKAADGILSLSGTSKDVYLVLDKAEGAEDYGSRADKVTVGDINADRMRDSKAVVVDENTALTVTFGNDSPSGVGLNNLIGLEGSTLNLKDGRSENATHHDRFTVELKNALHEDVTDDYGFNGAVEGNDVNKHHASIDGTDGFSAKGMDTTFEGTISADAAVDLSKTGDGKLTIGSGETQKGGIVADGSGLKLRDGSVTLQGDAEGGNKLGSLTFAYDLYNTDGEYVDEEGKEVKVLDDKTDNTGLTLTNGADLTLHDIGEAAVAADGTIERGGTITLGNDSVLTLDNAGKRCGTVLKDTHIVSAKGEVGSVVVAPDSKLVLAEAATLEGVNLEVQGNALTSLEGDKHIVTAGQLKLSGGTLDIGTSKGNSVGVIYGDGTLTASNGTALTVTGKAAEEEVFTGTLAGEGTLDVNGGAVTLQNVTTLPGTWDLSVNHAGALTLNSLTPAATVDPLGLMKFDDINVNGGTLTLSGNAKSNVKGKVHLSGDNTLHVDIVEGETDVALDLDFFGADGKQLTQEELKKLQDKKQLTLELDGPGSTYFRPQLLGSNAGVWHLMLEIQPNDFFIGSHKNVRSGGNLIIDADNPYSAAYQYVTSPEGQSGDLAKVLSVLKQEIDAAGTSVPIHEEKMAAAVAGSAIATLGSASVQDVHRQMQSIGNRASMIGTGEMKVNADPVCKPMHTWVNAETGYHKVNADSWAPGYTLNGWGGTLGIARELTHRTSGGLALTAMYNDFKSDTADYAKGDLDTTYVSGFLTTHRGPWTHSFLATLGKEDVSLNRIVSYGTGSYRTNGDTDGFVAGAMYEVSYTKTFNRKHAMSLQPLFNVEFRHAKLGAYDERGSDAALHVDDVKADVVTFGLGSRFHAVLTQNAFGRPAMFEARALGKVDVGDNYGKSTNRLVHGNLTQEVEASEVGRVGGEIGAGITIPLRSRGGTIFVEASAEFRDRYTNFSTSAGYMYNY